MAYKLRKDNNEENRVPGIKMFTSGGKDKTHPSECRGNGYVMDAIQESLRAQGSMGQSSAWGPGGEPGEARVEEQVRFREAIACKEPSRLDLWETGPLTLVGGRNWWKEQLVQEFSNKKKREREKRKEFSGRLPLARVTT